MRRNTIGSDHNNSVKKTRCQGFTLIEILVVILIIALLMAISTPIVFKVRLSAKMIRDSANHREIVNASNLYAFDNEDKYQDSVATIGALGSHWHWHEPTRMIGTEALSPQKHRAMGEYLSSYLENASTMFCTVAPKKYKYLQQAWDAGDEWDNPETVPRRDSLSGPICFWSGYLGYLGPGKLFVGPKNLAGGRRQSKLMSSCYFGYGHWRTPNSFGSAHAFKSADVEPETYVSSAYWSIEDLTGENIPEVKLHAAYTDGHVETFSSTEAVPMRVSKTADGRVPYSDGTGPGIFYIPRNALR